MSLWILLSETLSSYENLSDRSMSQTDKGKATGSAHAYLDRRENMRSESFTHIQDFLHVVHALFGEDGCPWVKELQLELLQRTLLEEAYEVISSISAHEWEEVHDELGDLLFNVLCIAKVLERDGKGMWEKPFLQAAEKYRRRNPHVFLPGKKLKTRKEVEKQWLEIKKTEKKSAKVEKNDLEKRMKGFPSVTLAEKLFDRIGHDEKRKSWLLAYLHEPASSQEQQLAREFLSMALLAYEKGLSLESLLRKELGPLPSALDEKDG